MKLKIGDKIPSFRLKDQNGTMRTSEKFNKPLVLFFYPKDDTPGCTIEACGFRDKYDLFKILGADVWGISNDSSQSHLEFANKNKLPYPLLCDANNILRNFSNIKICNINVSPKKGWASLYEKNHQIL